MYADLLILACCVTCAEFEDDVRMQLSQNGFMFPSAAPSDECTEHAHVNSTEEYWSSSSTLCKRAPYKGWIKSLRRRLMSVFVRKASCETLLGVTFVRTDWGKIGLE